MGLSKDRLVMGLGAILLLASCNQPKQGLCATEEQARNDRPFATRANVVVSTPGNALDLTILTADSISGGRISRYISSTQMMQIQQADYLPISQNATILIERQRDASMLSFQVRISAVKIETLGELDQESLKAGYKGPVIEAIKKCPTLMASLEDQADGANTNRNNSLTFEWNEWQWQSWQFNGQSRQIAP